MALSYEQKKSLVDYLASFTSEKRVELLKHVLSYRTRYLTVLLEDIYQSQNASAVLRTSDCFGIQDVHIVENTNQFCLNPKVVMGSSKWLTLNHYNKQKHNTLGAIRNLKDKGYRIVATSPHTYVTTLQDFDVTKGKFALLFGTELTGLSQVALDNADEYLMIPTYGFTESLNISVSAALCLQNLTERIRKTSVNYSLSDEEYTDLLLEWLRKSIRSWRSIEKRFLAIHKIGG